MITQSDMPPFLLPMALTRHQTKPIEMQKMMAAETPRDFQVPSKWWKNGGVYQQKFGFHEPKCGFCQGFYGYFHCKKMRHFATCETSLSLDHALLVEFQILHLQPLHMEPEQGPGYDDFNEGHGPAVRCHVNFYYHLLRIPQSRLGFHLVFPLLKFGLQLCQWIIQVFPSKFLAINWSHLLCRDVRFLSVAHPIAVQLTQHRVGH